MAMDSGESFNGELEGEDGNVPLADLLPSFLVKPASIVTVMEKISYKPQSTSFKILHINLDDVNYV
ncbi:hypothetical protein F2Q68_00030466 [Brassica cretica]|uniref:Uncharacterized protein n=1 Tax=Brassica cretica TaxID=69181 RepID=A0A8S9G2Y8_BRACR|nr:hypothetical protein F2Q68_00030466 [Brassica cretica]